VALEKKLEFTIDLVPGLPATIRTDATRAEADPEEPARQRLQVHSPGSGTPAHRAAPRRRRRVSVTDSGIGIPPEKQQVIFEAFQQADGSTSRQYGGTGLGLSISRELARLLGGELELQSRMGEEQHLHARRPK